MTIHRIFVACIMTSLFGVSANCEAETTTFSDPEIYQGSETLITFDDSRYSVFDEVGLIGAVGFRLLDEGTLSDSGQGPQVASAPNTTYAREFPPSDGARFIQVAFDRDLEIRFGKLINTVSAEIRARPITFSPETLTYELYAGDRLVSTTTIPDRTGGKYGDFFSYGVQSALVFDRLVIRNRLDERFALDNLRFAKLSIVSEPSVVERDSSVTNRGKEKLCRIGHRTGLFCRSRTKWSCLRRYVVRSWRSK